MKSLLFQRVRKNNIIIQHACNLICLDGLDTICLDILTGMLYPRGIGKGGDFLKKIEVIHFSC